MSIGLGLSIAKGVMRTLAQRVRSLFSRQGAGNAHAYMFSQQTPVLGPELVVNGDFSGGATGWLDQSTGTGSLSFSGGVVTTTGVDISNRGRFAQVVSGLSVGKQYRVLASVVSGSASSQLVMSGSPNIDVFPITGVQTIERTLTAAATSSQLSINTYGAGSVAWDNISVKEILSYNDLISGFHTGNYLDSAGTTVATVDNPVGLVLDGAGSVGAELNTDYLAQWAANDASATKTADGFTTSASGTGIKRSGLTVGKTYRIDIQGAATTAVSIYNGITPRVLVRNGLGYANFKADYDTLYLRAESAATVVTGLTITIKEVTGIHASQSTTGFRPALRKGIVNLLTQSEFQAGLTDAPTRSNVTLSSIDGKNAIAFGTAGVDACAYKSLAHTNGLTYTFACVVQMDDGGAAPSTTQVNNTCSLGVVMFSNLSGTAQSLSLGSGRYLVLSTQVSYGAGNGFGVVKYEVSDSRTFKVTSYGLFQGTLTASKILQYGGIPLTTTAAASSSLGPSYLEFDGTDDRMTLGSVPFQMADDFCLTAAVRCSDISVTRHIICATGGGGTQRISFYITPTTGQITAFFRDDAGNNTVKQAAGNFLNVGVIAQVVKRNGNISIWINGVLSGTESAINPLIGTTTLTEFAIAGSAIVGNYFKGAIYECAPVKGTFTDADIVTMAKGAAQIAGVTF